MEGTFIHQILDAGEWETAEKCWKCGWIQKRQQKPLKNRGRTETCEEMWWIYNLKNLKTTLERRNKQLNRWKNWRQEWQCIESSNKISKYVQYFLCFGGNIKNKKKPYKDWWLGWRCVLLFAQGREKKRQADQTDWNLRAVHVKYARKPADLASRLANRIKSGKSSSNNGIFAKRTWHFNNQWKDRWSTFHNHSGSLVNQGAVQW